MQAVLELHDTSDSQVCRAPVGLGVVWIFQDVPFHASANVPLRSLPTAVHAVADVHDTPDSTENPGGLGVAWIFQDVPFHASANVPLGPLPTAMHEVADVHDTLDSDAPPEVRGALWSFQAVPFHASASVTPTPELLPAPPTAMHDVADVHDTPDKAPPGAVALALAWIDQVEAAHAVSGGIPSRAITAAQTPTTNDLARFVPPTFRCT